ncbi:MAG TPA: nitroreductase [Puia sp.]|nr:nitroreductase [Puia sp.]
MERTTAAQLTRQTETEKTIFARRAVRTYKADPVERALIERVLDAGRMAPSAMNRQPWHFYILTDTETIKLFSRQIGAKVFRETLHSGAAALAKGAKEIAGLLHLSHGLDLHAFQDPVFHGAPVVVFITAPRDNEWAPLDIGMCAQNIMLSAQSLGLSSCPVGFGKFVENTPAYERLMIPPSEQVQLSIIIGYSDETPEPHPRRQDNLSFID